MPFTISVFGDTANSGTVLGENPIRANYTGEPIFGPGTHTADKWFNHRRVRYASRLHIRQRRPKLDLRAKDAISRHRSCAQFPRQ